jgi:nitric oxide reductase NorE protein
LAASSFGLIFLSIKAFEYWQKIDHGVSQYNENFITLYFLLTGFHALHVVLGILFLGFVSWKNSIENLETGVAFWHMVDLIWVLLFPIIYLIR